LRAAEKTTAVERLDTLDTQIEAVAADRDPLAQTIDSTSAPTTPRTSINSPSISQA
jgi:hypothetical protein